MILRSFRSHHWPQMSDFTRCSVAPGAAGGAGRAGAAAACGAAAGATDGTATGNGDRASPGTGGVRWGRSWQIPQNHRIL